MEGQFPPSLALGNSEPETHQVASWERGQVIFIRRARVKDMGSRMQELDIAQLKHHMQTKPHARILQHLQRLQLLRRQWRDLPDIREALERLDEVGIGLREDARVVGAGLEVEERLAHVLVFAEGGLAFAVVVPDGLCEGLGDVGALALQGVPDVLGGGEVGFAAFEGAGYAEEADDVAVVDVEELAVVGVSLTSEWGMKEKLTERLFCRCGLCRFAWRRRRRL